jgi:hypothetical protein
LLTASGCLPFAQCLYFTHSSHCELRMGACPPLSTYISLINASDCLAFYCLISAFFCTYSSSFRTASRCLPSAQCAYFAHQRIHRVRGGGGIRGTAGNLAGLLPGRGFVLLWAVLCVDTSLPKRFCVWAAYCGAVLLTSMFAGCLGGPPSPSDPMLVCIFSHTH